MNPIRLKIPIATLILMAFVLLHGGLFSQNWNPFPNGGTHLFTFDQQGSSETWIHGVKVDSLGLSGGDSAYYFNKINRYGAFGDTLNGCGGPGPVVLNPILLEQENLFGHKMIIGSGGDYTFVGLAGDTFLLKTQLAPGSSWPFTTGITATLDSIESKMVLGQADSVMYVSLSNSRSIQLSKDHGFVSCFSFLPHVNLNQTWETVDFTLWGIPDMGLGDTLPGARGVLNYDVGDRFGRKRVQDFAYNTATTETHTHTEITGKTPVANGITYNSILERLQVDWFPYSNPDTTYTPPTPQSGTSYYADYSFLDLLPYESVPAQQMGDIVQIGVRFSSYWAGRIEYLYEEIVYYDSCIPALTRFEDRGWKHYGYGLGGTYSGYISNGESDVTRLYCYVKATDSLTPCIDLGGLVGVGKGLDQTIEMAIGPVPARDQLQVEIENYHGFGGLDLAIVDLQGRTVREMHLPSGQTRAVIDVRNLKSGMYALQIRAKNGSLGWKKFVVQN